MTFARVFEGFRRCSEVFARLSFAFALVAIGCATPSVAGELKLRCTDGQFARDEKRDEPSLSRFDPFDITLDRDQGTMRATGNPIMNLSTTSSQYIGKQARWSTTAADTTEFRAIIVVDRHDLLAINSLERRNGRAYGSVRYKCALLGTPKI